MPYRLQLRVDPQIHRAIEAVRRDLERDEFYTKNTTQRISGQEVLRPILQYAGLLPPAQTQQERERYLIVMRIISELGERIPKDEPPPPKL